MRSTQPICGIYLVTNLVSGHRYVGQSIDILYRHRCRMNAIGREDYEGRRWRQEADCYGLKHLELTVIEECSPFDLDKREAYWIDRMQPEINSRDAFTGGIIKPEWPTAAPETRQKQLDRLLRAKANEVRKV